MELHELTFKFVTASLLFHSTVFRSYRNTKGKIKAAPLHVMKEYGGYGGIFHSLVTLALKGEEWSASRNAALLPQKLSAFPTE